VENKEQTMYHLTAAELARRVDIVQRDAKEKHRTVHKPVCPAIQELEKQKTAKDAEDDLNTTFPCPLTPRQQAG